MTINLSNIRITGSVNSTTIAEITEFIEQQKLVAGDSETAVDKRFGTTVALSGDTLAVAATGENNATGTVYIFVQSGTTWTQQAKLVASDPSVYDTFGASVSLSGDTLAVGAVGEDTSPTTDNGAVYIFTRSGTTWSEQAKLVASDRATNDSFGMSVCLSGDTLAVGAHFENTSPTTYNGAVYIFTRSGTTWTEQQKLLASDKSNSDRFGASVSLSGDTLAVGAYYEDTGPNTDNGAVYIFTRSGTTWTEQQKLLASDATTGDWFGYSISLDGDTLAVGAHLEDTGPTTDNGAVYIFTRSGTTWTEQAKVIASDVVGGERFGQNISLSGDTLAVGAHLEDTGPNTDNGAVYIFTRSGTTWTEQQKLLASDATTGDWFGISVDIDNNTVAVGAHGVDGSVYANNGAAYIFAR